MPPVGPDGVGDICAAAGLEKPDLSILSDEFLAKGRGYQNRAIETVLVQAPQ